MKLGITLRNMGPQSLPEILVPCAEAADAAGLESLWITDHLAIPPDDAEGSGGRYTDPLTTLAYLAARTQRIRLGTGIGLVAQHDPITFAKELATLDLLSGGRLVLGIGYGWNVEEMENHGIDTKRRRARVRECMLAMQALWSNEVAEFHGEFVDFAPSWQWPKPLQQPRPPVLIGGAAGPKLFDHIAEYADGWLPIGGAGLREALPKLHAAMEARGRDPKALEIVPMGVFPSEEKLAYYRESGVTECVLRLPSAPRDEVMPVLDDYAKYL